MCPELCGTKDLLKQQHGHNNKYNHGGDCEPCCVPKFRSAAGESWWVSFMSVDTPNWMVEYGWILRIAGDFQSQCFPTCVFQTTKTGSILSEVVASRPRKVDLHCRAFPTCNLQVSSRGLWRTWTHLSGGSQDCDHNDAGAGWWFGTSYFANRNS